MTARTCRCGKPITGSKYTTQCGSCGRKRLAAAQVGGHRYQRTHVHVWPDGSKTMELGTSCGEGEE